MKRFLSITLAITASLYSTSELATADEVSQKPVIFVRDHKALGAIILPENADDTLKALAADFAELVERASGAKLPIIPESEEAKLSKETGRLFVGPTHRAEAEGIHPDNLPEEGYRIIQRGNALILVGRDLPRNSGIQRTEAISQPTRWGLNRLAEDHLGVRWLWPGKLGTYVPKQGNFEVTTSEVTYQPVLRSRVLVPNWNLRTSRRDRPPTGRLTPEEVKELVAQDQATIQAGVDWLENHQGGERGNVPMPSHAFNKWWERYGASNPEFFAQPPPGEKLATWRPGSIKLRLSNPDVIEQIAKEYEKARAPLYWPMTPTDAGGFDTSEGTLAWDLPQGQDIIDIWKGKANLTARYVTFWNRVHDRLKQINPDVTLTVFAYSSYKYPPPPERPITARLKMGMVPGYNEPAYKMWKGWADLLKDGGISLRPNWWHLRANAPHLPLEEFANYLKFASENRMDAIRMDSINGYWGTKGPSYYFVARLMNRPELTKDQVLNEYTSAFGSAAPKIREYLDYWQKVTTDQDRFRSSVPEVQKFLDDAKVGIYNLYSSGDQPVLIPSLYPDAVVNPAMKLLDEANELVGNNDPEAKERVAFLKDGLKELVTARDTVALGMKVVADGKKDKALLEEFNKKAEELAALREELTKRHVIWGSSVTRNEYNRRIPSASKNLSGGKVLKANPPTLTGEDNHDL